MNQPSAPRSFRLACFLGYLITSCAVLALPVIALPPENRSAYFWYKVAWTELLSLIVWAYIGGFFWSLFPSSRKPRKLAGILPATGLLVVGYAITSFLLVLLCDWPGRGHWVGQVVLLLVFALLLIFFEFVRIGAALGTEPMPCGVGAPQDLAAMLRYHEDRLWVLPPEVAVRQLSDTIKTLREKLQHSLPDAGLIGQTQEYQEFVRQTEAFCTELHTIPSDGVENAKVSRLRDVATQLTAQIEQIGFSLKPRPC